MTVNIKYYKLKTKTSEFYAILLEDGTLTVGGKIKGCVFITPVKHNIAVLERLNYDARCNIDGTLQRSHGTVTMIKAALEFAFEIHPELKEIQLQDHSYKECFNKTLMLGPLYITLYGETWYEKKFNAKLKNKHNYMYINEYNIHVHTKPEWDTLWSKFIEPNISVEDTNTFKKQLKKYWTNSNSFREMIKHIINNNHCNLIVDWLEIYFIYYTKIDITKQLYIIKRTTDTDTNSSIEIEKSEISNPYINSLSIRQNKEKSKNTSEFMNYVPRKVGGTMIQIDIDIMG